MIKQIKRRGKRPKEGKLKNCKLRERNNQKKKMTKKTKILIRLKEKNKLLRHLMNPIRKKRRIKKKKTKQIKKNQNLLKKEMKLMNQVHQSMQTLKILVIMQEKNSFLKKVSLKEKNLKKSKIILHQMIKNLTIDRKKKKQR